MSKTAKTWSQYESRHEIHESCGDEKTSINRHESHGRCINLGHQFYEGKFIL